MKTQIEMVTPEQAAIWLKSNTRNRSLKASVASRMARDITAGEWRESHEGIGIGPSFLVDGQHRLTAIVQAGISVEMLVSRYETDEAAEAALLIVDRGNSRSDADVLAITGKTTPENSRAVAGVLKILYRGGFGGAGAKGYVKGSTVELSALYCREKDHVDWAVQTIQMVENRQRFGIPHKAAFCVAHMLDPVLIVPLSHAILDAESPDFSISRSWRKAEEEGKLSSVGRASLRRNTWIVFLLSLRLLQAAIAREPAPKILRPGKEVIGWFRSEIKRARNSLVGRDIEMMEEENVA